MSAWRGLLEQLVRERGRALFGFAYMLTGSRDEAEDLLQDALVRAFSSGRRASSLDAAHIYVKRAISTAFIDRARRASTRPRTIGSESDLGEWVRTVASSPDHAGRVDAALDLQSALLMLAPRERACVVLRFVDDMTVDAVANTLGLAPGTVKRYLSDARGRLRELLPGRPEEQARSDVTYYCGRPYSESEYCALSTLSSILCRTGDGDAKAAEPPALLGGRRCPCRQFLESELEHWLR